MLFSVAKLFNEKNLQFQNKQHQLHHKVANDESEKKLCLINVGNEDNYEALLDESFSVIANLNQMNL